MIFVINKLKYDTEKMELVSDKVRYCFYLMRCLTEARLYRSRKRRWLIVNENGTYGNKRRIICNECNCIFTYEKEDVVCKNSGPNELEFYVICPDCGNHCTTSP